tara:strand:- start:213 stop:2525 length:2313 start_codon:yes stop_codon:yes gene_type:complete
MAKSVDKITLLLDLKGFKAVKGLGQDFAKFKSTVKLSAREVDKAVKGLTKFHGNTKLSTNALRGQISALTRLKDNVGINTKAYKNLSTALDQAKLKMNQLTGASKKQGRFGAFGAGGSAAIGLAGGYLGGALGLNPAITGLAAAGADASARFAGKGIMSGAGLKGALIGGGIGAGVAGVGALVAGAKGAAEFSAQIRRLEVALRGVTKSQTEFAKAQKVITSVSKELNVPIANATQQFTTLTASVIGAGGSVDEAELVFRGVSEAIKATGGDAEDVKSAIRAMSQIFGKGKVSAEELQGQLGERLPGAVTKFAAATGRTLPQLQKDLRDGTVGLNDVMKFVVRLSDDHAEAAREMARSSADAGQRMQVTFDELKKNVGDILQPLGAEIQDFTEVAVNNLNRFIAKIKEALKIGDEYELENVERNIKRLEKLLGERAFTGKGDFFLQTLPGFAQFEALKGLGNTLMSADQRSIFEDQLEAFKLERENILARQKMMDELKSGVSLGMDFGSSGLGLGSNVFGGDGKSGNVFEDPVSQDTENDTKKARDILDKYAQSVKAVNQQIANAFVNTFKKMEDALVDFVMTGTLNFRKFALSIIQEITRIFIRSQIIKPLMSAFGGFNLFGGGGGKSSSFIIPDKPIVGVTGVPNTGSTFNPFENAKGNVFAKNKIVPYAMGGTIVRKPSIFPMANGGVGLMAEAGYPEAIMPLKRGRDGKLGVIAQGGGVGNIVVNVDASGSSVEGQEQQSAQLGRMLGAVVQAELIKQKRPGGLLG